jgi:hypothetical protein
VQPELICLAGGLPWGENFSRSKESFTYTYSSQRSAGRRGMQREKISHTLLKKRKCGRRGRWDQRLGIIERKLHRNLLKRDHNPPGFSLFYNFL